MGPAGKLPQQDWMTAPDICAVIAALTAEGAEVRFVGGCVRDAVVGRSIKDIDLATPDEPQAVIALLERAGLKAVPTGIDHGTVTAVSDHRPVEVTTLRHDVESFGRHATVAFTDDWEADAARRDLTMNALSCAPDGTLYDPFGGLDDLARGHVRFVGDARTRIQEDYLRLLRFFRFYAHYGRGDFDTQALAAAEELAPHLDKLSAERVREELLRLLGAADPVPVLRKMQDAGVLAVILPEMQDIDRLAALINLESLVQKETEAPDALRRLAALAGDGAGRAVSLANRFRLSNLQEQRLTELALVVGEFVRLGSDNLKGPLHFHGKDAVRDALLIFHAGNPSRPVPALEKQLAAAENWTRQVFPLKGQDVLNLGVAAGPPVGQLLRQVEDWWFDKDFLPDRDACLTELKRRIDVG